MPNNQKNSAARANFLRKLMPVFLMFTHNSLAFVGVALVFAIIALSARPEIRQAGEAQLVQWLQNRQAPAVAASMEISDYYRPNNTNREEVSKQQSALVRWLSKKYNVAPEPLSALVSEVYATSAQAKLDPTLILAVMAIESGFNPFAQSSMGAQGLMQVMTSVHHEKYENFGGKQAAFHPVVNMRVGVKVLQDCIRRYGSVEKGLKCYVGASDMEQDGGYAVKVLAEQARLNFVSGLRNDARAAYVSSAPIVTPADPSILKSTTQQEPAFSSLETIDDF